MATKPKYEIRYWLGKYEAYISYHVQRANAKWQDKVLTSFFNMFPKKIGMEEFNIADVGDFIQLRTHQGANSSTLVLEVSCINRLWKFMIESHKLFLYNIAKAYTRDKRRLLYKKRSSLSLEEMLRLFNALEDITLRHLVLDLVEGKDVRFKVGTERLQAFTEAAERCGLSHVTPNMLRSKVRDRLNKDILISYVAKLRADLPPRIVPPSSGGNWYKYRDSQEFRDAFAKKSQLASDTTRTIKLPAPYVWTSVRDSRNDLSPSEWIIDQQARTEGKSPVSDSHTVGVEVVPVGHSIP